MMVDRFGIWPDSNPKQMSPTRQYRGVVDPWTWDSFTEDRQIERQTGVDDPRTWDSFIEGRQIQRQTGVDESSTLDSYIEDINRQSEIRWEERRRELWRKRIGNPMHWGLCEDIEVMIRGSDDDDVAICTEVKARWKNMYCNKHFFVSNASDPRLISRRFYQTMYDACPMFDCKYYSTSSAAVILKVPKCHYLMFSPPTRHLHYKSCMVLSLFVQFVDPHFFRPSTVK